jgi:hypothetical protein
MTAGNGIIHQEMPQPAERMLGLQLWLNLPAKDKMTQPQYRDLTADKIPKVEQEGCRVAVLSGQYGGSQGPTSGDFVQATILDVDLAPGYTWQLATDPQATLFVYLFSGSGSFGGPGEPEIGDRRALLFDVGERFQVTAGQQGLRLMLFSGRPLHEPIAWGGPIVMNTQEELSQAFAELRQGTFITSGHAPR